MYAWECLFWFKVGINLTAEFLHSQQGTRRFDSPYNIHHHGKIHFDNTHLPSRYILGTWCRRKDDNLKLGKYAEMKIVLDQFNNHEKMEIEKMRVTLIFVVDWIIESNFQRAIEH